MPTRIRVLGFSGSLRQASYNTGLLRAASELLPASMTLDTFDLAPIPLYNADVQAQGFPESVQQFRDQIMAADALLIASPEYNYSVSGVLKNAIDWASRPGPDGALPLHAKPLAIMGASTGAFGTVRGQLHLRQIAVYTNMLPVNKPEVLVMHAKQKFNDQGRLVDEQTRGFVRDLLEALERWTHQLRGE